VAVVRTDKADIEVEVFESGVVGELLVEEGTRVPVGTPLAAILPREGAAAAARRAAAPAAPPPSAPLAPPAPPAPPPAAAHPPVAAPAAAALTGRARVTPRARRLAAEHAVDLGAITKAVGNRPVTGADVEAGLAGPAPAVPVT